jgi:hypothetical protein
LQVENRVYHRTRADLLSRRCCRPGNRRADGPIGMVNLPQVPARSAATPDGRLSPSSPPPPPTPTCAMRRSGEARRAGRRPRDLYLGDVTSLFLGAVESPLGRGGARRILPSRASASSRWRCRPRPRRSYPLTLPSPPSRGRARRAAHTSETVPSARRDSATGTDGRLVVATLGRRRLLSFRSPYSLSP